MDRCHQERQESEEGNVDGEGVFIPTHTANQPTNQLNQPTGQQEKSIGSIDRSNHEKYDQPKPNQTKPNQTSPPPPQLTSQSAKNYANNIIN